MINRDLALRLLALAKVDQELRKVAFAATQQGIPRVKAWQSVAKGDRIHTRALKAIIKEHGWPTISAVGKKASHAAWLIAQHADHDLAFQKRALLHLVRAGADVDPKNVAYLLDRVLVADGKRQVFGTQFRHTRGATIPYLLKDKEHVDALRAAVGLEPLADYQQRIWSRYEKKARE